MNDLKQDNRKLQIFYTFVSNFDTLKKTVGEMVVSNDADDFMRAEGILNIIAEFTYDIVNIQSVIDKLKSLHCDERLQPLYNDLVQKLYSQQDSILMQMTARQQILMDVLLKKDVSDRQVADSGSTHADALGAAEGDDSDGENKYVGRVAQSGFMKSRVSDRIIKRRKGISIEGHDLTVINDIASATVSKGELLSDYAKKYKTPRIRDIITRLYHESSYYFEQAFSNTDVNIQFIILEILTEDQQKDQKNDAKKQALSDLQDLHVLSTIDTSANKMTSKVSDHQAFELFLSALSKNDNDYIINKLISDDIIMKTMFSISTRSKEANYGFRRMFTTSKHPYDGIIVDKFKKLMDVSQPMFLAVIKDLSRDDSFKKAYQNYMKTEQTKTFLQVLIDCRNYLFEDELTNEMIQGIDYVLKEFEHVDRYNHDLLTYELMNDVLEGIYWYIIRKDAYDKYPLLHASLAGFYRYRVLDSLNSTKRTIRDFGGEKTFGITHTDMWYDCHKMIKHYGWNHIEKLYIRYGKDEVYEFELGSMLRICEKKPASLTSTSLPAGHFSMLMSNSDKQGFDQYIYNLFSRIIKMFMGDHIHTTLTSVKSSMFRKIEIPGLSVRDDQRIRKAILDYMTLLYLWRKDEDLFLHVYRRRISPLLDTLSAIRISYENMMPFVEVDSNRWILTLFSHKGLINRMLNDFERIGESGKDSLIKVHGASFFALADRQKKLV